MYNINTKG